MIVEKLDNWKVVIHQLEDTILYDLYYKNKFVTAFTDRRLVNQYLKSDKRVKA